MSFSSTSIVIAACHCSNLASDSLLRPIARFQNRRVTCELNDRSVEADSAGRYSSSELKIGSPIIVTEAPKTIKTAASIPCLRVNSGLVNPGDVGRIVSRKPKDIWAVRLSIGTYLIEGKYFKPLELDA
ncbi:hypothetical protein Nepgr_000221 [Nepenthes gracilis]|uniref:Chlororespiratory reduction 42 n=1 Tax=Nepenthes gracilis TaxID=150966 RepID=A0AAD3RVC5_NEPGR|nr:hypothetical protein Nepgr_000221 [Nepenthes gracilis]